MNKPGVKYIISAGLARSKGIPRVFLAAELASTPRGAVYLYGHGTTDPISGCCKCGRTLTHPGSILLGIGPECLKDWGMRDLVLDNITEADKQRLQDYVHSLPVDTWLPTAAIKKQEETTEIIAVPDNHKMLNGKAKPAIPQGTQPMEPPLPVRTATLDTSGKFAIIRFPYDAAIVEGVRALEGRKWNAADKFWSAWASQDNLQKLVDLGFTLDEKLLAILSPLPVKEVKITQSDLDIPGLYPYQLEGVSWLEAHNGTGLLGHEMGLGKTIISLGWLKLHPEIRPVVCVVPASLKINWQREAAKWIGEKALILSGKKPSKTALKKATIIIINYDILGAWLHTLIEIKPKVLIGDEIHFCKNPKAARTKCFKELQKHVEHFIPMSGTPITNRPNEFYPVLNMLDPREFNSWFRFAQRYCGMKYTGFGWDTSGATNTEELFERINNRLMIRHKKADVLKDLPAKQRFVVPMDINNRAEYNHADINLISWVKEAFGKGKAEKTAQAEALARFSYLKQLAAEGKREQAINWIKDTLDSNGKLVLMAVHHVMIDYLAEELRNYNPVVVDGRVNQDNRQKAVDRFQNDDTCRVFIGNIKAAGVGITLTAASNVVFLELGWTPGEMEQAADRIHRIGQVADSVNVWYLVAADTIEEEIAQILDTKQVILDAVLDGKVTEQESMLTELLRKRLED